MEAPVAVLLSVVLLVVAIGLIASAGYGGSYYILQSLPLPVLGFVILGLVFGYYAGRFHESLQNTPLPPPSGKMFCVYCGAENASADVLCKKCGKKLLRPV